MPTDPLFLTLAIALGAGAFFTVVARKFALPGIVLFFVGGLLFGPEGLGWILPAQIDAFLPAIATLALGIILFEGGLSLGPRDHRPSRALITRLLTIGALVTWLGSAVVVKFSFGLAWAPSLLAGSLVMATGPSVILPILRRMRLNPEIASILRWEGVLIDVVGVFLALLCYELVIVQETPGALLGFGGRLLAGGAIGLAGGFLIRWVLDRALIPDSLTDLCALALAIGVFALSEWQMRHTGLFAVSLAGVVAGRPRSSEQKRIRTIKGVLSDFLIGTLFILLVSRLQIAPFVADAPALLLAVGLIMFVVRPLNIFMSTLRTGLSVREQLFLSWIAPRGIVAAALASLFALQWRDDPRFVEEAVLLETFTFSIILATVVLQGLSAGWWARLLGVARPRTAGWLFVGADRLARELAREMIETGDPVLLIDSNERNVANALTEGLPALRADARDVEQVSSDPQFLHLGNFLALTDNDGLNAWLASIWRPHFGREHTFAWQSDPDPGAEGGFSGLPRPAVLSEELRRGATRVRKLGVSAAADGHAVFARTTDAWVAVGTQRGLPPDAPHLFILRLGGYLERALARGRELQLSCPDLPALYDQLGDLAVSCEPRLSREQLVHDLVAQEAILPPFLGHGIAAPHAYSPDITARVCFRVELVPVLAVPGVSEPIHTVYFIISPAGDPEGHLATLAEIAQRCRKEVPRKGSSRAGAETGHPPAKPA